MVRRRTGSGDGTARRRLLRASTAAITLCAGLGLSPAAATAAAPKPAAVFVADINAARAAHGLKPVKVSSDLTAVAAKWAATMARKHTLAHNPQLGTVIHHWRGLAENVGMGYSVTQVHGAFMRSAPHRANILDRTYTQVGVGVVIVGKQVYVVEDFRRPA
ncbi:MAG: hypothetical protein QOE24_1499 [Frankiales bacterium]|nr:hypothetical protein [Frankiales bacterium]